MSAKPAKALERSPRPAAMPRASPLPAPAPPLADKTHDAQRGMSNAAVATAAHAAPAASPAAQVVKLPRKGASNAKVSLAAKGVERHHAAPKKVHRTAPLSTETRHAAAASSKKGLNAARDKAHARSAAASKPAASKPAPPAVKKPSAKPAPRRAKVQPKIVKHAPVKHPAIKKTPRPAAKKRAAPKTAKPAFRLPRLAMPATASAGARRVLDKLGAAAAKARQGFADRIAKGTALMSARGEQARQSIQASGARQAGRLRGAFQTSRTQIERSAGNAQAQAHAAGAKGQATVAQMHAGNTARAGSEFAAKQQRARTLGETYSQQATKTASDVAGNMQTAVSQRAQEARNIGKSMAQRGSPPEVAEAKRKVAVEISEDTASKVSGGVEDGAEQIRSTAPQASEAFQHNGEDIATQLGNGKSGLIQQLDGLATQANSSIQQAADGSAQQFGQTKSALAGQLAAGEADHVAHLNEEMGHKAQEAQHAAGDASEALNAQGEKTLAAGDAHIGEIAKRIAAVNVPAAKADELSQMLSNQLTQGFDGIGAQVDTAASGIGNKLTTSGGQVAAAGDTATSAVGQKVQGSAGKADAQFKQQQQQLTSQLGQIADGTGKTGGDTIAQIGTALDDNLGKADESFKQSLGDYRAHLTDQVTGADSKAGEPVGTLTNRIDTAQQRAAIRAERSWISNQVHDLGEMLSDPGFWAALVVGLILAVIVIALVVAGTLTGGLAIVLAMAVAGAIAAAVGSIVGQATDHSFTHGWDSSRISWAQVGISAAIGFVAAAAITAVVLWMGPAAMATWQGVAAMSGAAGVITLITNFVTGQPLTKGLLANMLLAGVLAWLAKFIPIPRFGPRPPPEIEPPPEIKPPAETPAVQTPRVIRMESPAQIEATEPVESVTEGKKVMNWRLYDSKSGAQFSDVDANIEDPANPGPPDQYLTPKKATIPGNPPETVTLEADFPFTDESLIKNRQVWEKLFGKPLKNYSGSLADQNLANFQKEFATLRDGGMDPQSAGNAAIKKVSFGRARGSAGYGDLSVEMSDFGDVTVTEGKYAGQSLKDVPKTVKVNALETKKTE